MRRIVTILAMFSLFLLIAAAAFLFGCTPLFYYPNQVSFEDRRASFSTESLPLEHNVSVYWNKHAVPYIEAQTDDDAAFALGYTHAHLHLGQMELLRKLSQGRLSEMAGPFTRSVDHSLRILDMGKAADELAALLSPETKRWVERFVDGINTYAEHSDELPAEFALLDLEWEPWTTSDVTRLSRLLGVDITWMLYVAFLSQEDAQQRDVFWNAFTAKTALSPASFSPTDQEQLGYYLSHFSKSGSNSVVVSGERTPHGAALIANDPHLGIMAPNFWVLAGLDAPSLNAVGMMIPGLPFFALGRNQDISWGGTNMRGISSHLFELSEKDEAELECRTENIMTRWWFDREVTICDSKLGPVISEAPFVKDNRVFALSWTGHDPESNEIEAFLQVNRATNWKEFRTAFTDYAVSAQNMLYADKSGNVGHVLAYKQPIIAPGSDPYSLIKPREAFTGKTLRSTELPFAFNPDEGFIASANNKPFETPYPLAYSFAHRDRIHRLRALLTQADAITVATLQKLQVDNFAATDLALRDALVHHFDKQAYQLSPAARELWQALKRWDGYYRAESHDPVAFQLIFAHLVDPLLEQKIPNPTARKALLRASHWKDTALEILSADSLIPETMKLIRQGIEEAKGPFAQLRSWGAMHRQILQHPLGNIPLIGSRYRVTEYGSDGSQSTVNKTGHRLTKGPHKVSYGAQSRHISDLSDPNANYFVLLGGQDGWLNTPQLGDQVPLWRDGKYMQIPLQKDVARQMFRTHTVLQSADK